MTKTQFGFDADETDGLAATPQTRAVLNDVTAPSMAAPQILSSSVKASIFSAPPAATLDYVAGSESRVNTYTTSDQYYPYIAALTGGGYVVVWASAGQDGDGYGIYAQRYNAAGVAQGSEVHVSTATTDIQAWPTATGLSDGSYVVIWHSNNQDGGAYGIYMQRYNASGVAQGTETRVNSTTVGEQSFPAVAALSGGGYVASWQSPDASSFGIYSQRYNNSGVAQGSETAVNATTSGNQRNPGAASLSDGGYVITWESNGTDGSGYGIYAQRYSASGVAQGAETRVNTYTSGDQYRSAAVGLSGGGYVIVWESSAQDGDDFGIYMQRFNGAGVAQGAEARVNSTTAGLQSFAWVSTLSDGGFVVTWYGLHTTGSYEVYAQRYNATGVAQGSETIINTTTSGAQVNPIVTTLVNGDYVVAWASAGQDGDGQGIYRKHLQANYEPVLTGTGTTLTAGNEDTPYSVTRAQLVAGFTDQDGETLDVSGLNASNGTVVNNGDGTWTITPAANFNGTMTLTYSVTDGLESTAATLTYAVNAVNDAPAGTPTGTVANGVEDTTQTILATTLLQGISDVEGQALSVSAISADHGTLTTTDGGWIFTPADNYSGLVTLTYSVTDGTDVTSGFTRTFSLDAANDAPAGTPTGVVADGSEDTVQLILESLLLEGLTDVDGQTLTVSAISVDHGTLTAATGGWTFTPAANYHGVVTLTYSVTDGTEVASGFTRPFSLNAANDAPAGTPTGVMADGSEDTAQLILESLLLEGLTDVDGQTLTISAISVDHGTLTATTEGWTFTPTANYHGVVTLTYSVTDGADTLLDLTRTFTLGAVNDAPAGAPTATIAIGTEDVAQTILAASLLTGFSDFDGDTLSVAAISADKGTLTETESGWIFTPNTDYNGPVILSYTVSDGMGGAVTNQTRNFTLSAVDDATTGTPTGAVANGSEDTTQIILAATLLEGLSDIDGALTVSDISADHGTLTVTEGGWTFIPVANYNGEVILTYTVSDGQGGELAGQTRTFNLASVPDAPVATAASFTIAEDGTLEDSVVASDGDGDALAYVLGTGPVHGMLDFNADGTFTYTPDANHNGADSFTFFASDGSHTSAETTVTLTVTPVDDIPTGAATGSIDDGVEDTTQTILAVTLLAGFEDVDGDLAVTDISADHGSLAVTDGGWIFTPDSNYNGPVVLTCTLSDGTTTFADLTRGFELAAVNDAPIGTPTGTIADGTEDTSQVILESVLLQGLSDVEGQALSVSAITVSHGALTATTGGWTFTPDLDYNGAVTVTYSVSDGPDATTGFTRSFSLAATPDTPTLTGTVSPIVTDEDTSKDVTFAMLIEGYSDGDGDTLTLSGLTASQGTLVDNNNGTYTLTPPANYFGTITLSYTVNDGTGLSLNTSLGVAFASVNDLPTGSPTGTVANGTEDTAQTILAADLLQGFSDVEGALTVSAISVSSGTLTVTTGGWTYTPAANYNGPVVITYTVRDSDGATLTGQTRSFTLASVEDVPIGAAPALAAGTEDVTYTVTRAQLLSGFSDGDGDPLSVENFTATYSAGYLGGTVSASHSSVNAVYGAAALAGGGYVESYRYHSAYNQDVTRVYDADHNVVATFSAGGRPLALSDGSFVLLQSTWSGNADLSVTRYSATGTVLNSQTGLVNPSATHEQFPVGAALSGGGYVVTWTETPVSGGSSVVKFQAFNNDGTANGSAHAVTANASYVQHDSQIAVLADGSIVVSWAQSGGDGSGYSAYAQRFEADGDPLGNAFVVNTLTNGAQHGVRMAALEGGGFVVTWADNTSWSRKFQVFDANGTKVGAETSLAGTFVQWLNNGSTSLAYVASEVIALDDGGFAIVSGVTTGAQFALFRYDALGNPLGTPMQVPADTSNPFSSNMYAITLADGSVQVMWTNEGNGNALSNRNFAEGLSGEASVSYDSATGIYSITRPADSNGLLTLEYQVNDGKGNTKKASTTLNINAVNDAPRGSATTVLNAIDEDGAIIVTRAQLLAGYSDPDAGTTLAIRNNTVTSSSGTVTYNSAAGTWTITPAANYHGTVTISYTVWDGTANATNGGSLSFAVNSINDLVLLTGAKAVISATEDIAKVITAAQLKQGYTDADGDTLTISGISADHGTITHDGNGNYTLTPESNYFGTVNVSYTLSDGNGSSLPTTLSVSFAAVNDAPAGTPTGTVADGTEDTAQTILASTLLAGFSDVEGQTLSVSAIAVSSGTLTATAGGWTYTPASNYNGPVTVTYTVSDGNGGTLAGQTRSFTLAAVDDVPVANAADFTLAEDNTLSRSVTGSDVETANVTYVVDTDVAHGTLTFNADGTFTYAPSANYNGPDSFTFKVYDGAQYSAAATVNLTVTSVNDLPTGSPTGTIANGTEDTAQTILAADLLQGFSDVEGALTISAISVTNGALTATSGGWTYTPTANYHGPVTVTYAVRDSDGATIANQTRSFSLASVNDLPAGSPTGTVTNGTEDVAQTILASTLLSGFSDVDGDTLTVSAISVTHGGLTVTTGGWIFTPEADYNGAVTVTYTVSDGQGGDRTDLTRSFNLRAVNDAPRGAATGAVADGTEDTSQTILASTLLAGFSDVEGQTLSVSNISVTNGALTTTSGGWIFTPVSNYNGPVTVTYTVSDGNGGTVTNQTRSFTLAAVNDLPVAAASSRTVAEDGVLTSSVSATDVEGSALTYVLDTNVSHGTLTFNADGTYTYTPEANYHGDDSFTYYANDGTADAPPATVTLTVTSVNDLPTGGPAGNVAYGVEDRAQTILAETLLEGFSDVEGALTVSAISADHGTLTVTTGGWTFTPEANYYGPVILTYTIQDSDGATIPDQTRSFYLSPVNDTPTGTPSGTVANGTEDTAQTILASTLLEGFSDVDGDTLTVSAISANHGTFVATTDGWVFTPEANYNGSVTVTYTVTDSRGGNVANQTRSFTLAAVNDAPMGSPTGTIADGSEDTSQTILASTLLAGFSDIDGDTLSVSAISADHGTLTATAGGWTFAPEANYDGLVTLTYTVSDGHGGTEAAQVRKFNLAAVNDTPTGAPTGAVANGTEDTSQTILASTLLAGFSDVDGDALTVSAISADHGTLTATSGGWTFTPDANYNGLVTLTYTVSDSNGGTVANQTRKFNLSAVNDAATGAPTGTVTDGSEDTSQTILASTLLAGFGDIDGDALSVSAISADHGTLTATTGGWTFTPAANYNGLVTLTYTVSDGTETLSEQTRTFTLAAVNDAPTGTPTGTIADGTEDTAQTILAATLLQGLSDIDSALSVTAISVDHGTLSVTTGGWTFTPEANYNGPVTVTYTVSDGAESLTGLTRGFTLAAVDDAPSGTPIGTIADGTEDTSQTILAATLLQGFSDVDGTPGISAISADHGTLTATPGGWTFTPDANYNGKVTLTYTVSDGQGGTLTGQQISFTLAAVNDAPTGTPTGTIADGTEDTAQTILAATLLQGLSDIDSTLSVTASSVDHGTLTVTTGGWTFTPEANYNGPVIVIYTVSDGAESLTGLTRGFTLAAVDDAPSGTPTGTISDGTEDTAQTILAATLLQGLSDIDSTLSVTAISVSHGALSVTSGGWVFTPEADYNGAVTVTYTVSDGTTSLTGLTRSFNLAAVTDIIMGTAVNDTLTGTAGADEIRALGGNDVLDGLGGGDLMYGGAGNDTYVVRDGDTVSEDFESDGDDGGIDLVRAHVGYVLGDYVENLELLGSAVRGTGNDLSNRITGSAANNAIDGKGGADTLAGGLGNDTYVVDDAGDIVVENDNEGDDLILSSVSYDLTGRYIETLTLTGSADINATGNTRANALNGNAGHNRLDGGLGFDTMAGGLGDDTYVVNVAGDIVVEQPGEGTDTVESGVNWVLGDNFENLVLTGTANLKGTGNAGNNVLTGNSGNNVLTGGFGNDSYYVQNTGDNVVEADGEGNDTIFSSVTYNLTGRYAEVLALTGSANIDALGNGLANTLIGNDGVNLLTGLSGHDRLDGGKGADVMVGGTGNDTYVVDHTGDATTENANEGIDLVEARITWSLGANIENLTLIGSADINATGNALNNVLTGNSGHNRLDGGVGIDTLAGGLGDDTYVVHSTWDVVTENADEGTDTIESAIALTLAGNVENLTLTGTAAINGTGNALNNVIIGNSGNNILAGGLGDDTYYIQNTGDNVVELGGEGKDLIYSAVTYTLNQRYVETLVLTGTANINATGNTNANTLIGNDGNNILNGKAGPDKLTGGLGADVFFFELDSAKDTITDFSAAQNDSINIHAFANGAVNAGWVSQIGADTVINLGNGNTITLLNTVQADVLSHIVW